MTERPKSRPRGRPPKPGGPVSAAERMRAYRARRKAAGVVVRRLSREERQKIPAYQSYMTDRKHLHELLEEVKNLKKECERLSLENEKLERARLSAPVTGGGDSPPAARIYSNAS